MSTSSSNTPSELNSILAKIGASMSKVLDASWGRHVTKYRPEHHYMRGPGPMWRQKHDLSHGLLSNASRVTES
jgi:hypothetical protein